MAFIVAFIFTARYRFNEQKWNEKQNDVEQFKT